MKRHKALLASFLVATMLISPQITTAVSEKPMVVVADQPTVPPATEVRGVMSWYDATRNWAWYTQGDNPYVYYAAAGPELRKVKNFKWGWDPYPIRITSTKTHKSIIAWVVDECMCTKLVDVAPAAFKALGLRLHADGIGNVIIEVYP
ncbi:MAG: hypothetical protein EBT03_09495 [Betaproteobacteria bacterium]|nr:hypothetical protein [Betaproteobacteria bacterium]NCA16797.1 hypothetical protein [Betaproteobacteria bacterium]